MRAAEFITEEQMDEIDRRGFLKGLGAAALSSVGGKALAQSDSMNVIRKTAGTAWDMRRLGWSRAQAMTAFQTKMGYSGELLKAAGLICNLAWSLPKDYLTREEFISKVSDAVTSGTRELERARELERRERERNAQRAAEHEREMKDLQLKNKEREEKRIQQENIRKYLDYVQRLLDESLERAVPELKRQLGDYFNYIKFMSYWDVKVQFTIEKSGAITDFSVLRNRDIMAAVRKPPKYKLSDLLIRQESYQGRNGGIGFRPIPDSINAESLKVTVSYFPSHNADKIMDHIPEVAVSLVEPIRSKSNMDEVIKYIYES